MTFEELVIINQLMMMDAHRRIDARIEEMRKRTKELVEKKKLDKIKNENQDQKSLERSYY